MRKKNLYVVGKDNDNNAVNDNSLAFIFPMTLEKAKEKIEYRVTTWQDNDSIIYKLIPVKPKKKIKNDRTNIDKEPKDIWNDNSPNGPWGD